MGIKVEQIDQIRHSRANPKLWNGTRLTQKKEGKKSDASRKKNGIIKIFAAVHVLNPTAAITLTSLNYYLENSRTRVHTEGITRLEVLAATMDPFLRLRP